MTQQVCGSCNGQRYTEVQRQSKNPDGTLTERVTCTNCNGQGWIPVPDRV